MRPFGITVFDEALMNWGNSKTGVLHFIGQYWQSVKRFAHTVELSYMQAQRHDHEENATVNALASLSVGVLNTKR